ncbi:hypothetical protein BVRB_3g069280 [Beta vulgaris subsp. vulgaris]|nr:hypothetical protein BVRB_3g069280 [Beta vulgaris subsp. vulgaris]
MKPFLSRYNAGIAHFLKQISDKYKLWTMLPPRFFMEPNNTRPKVRYGA